jgi:uncharacterized protein with von Willebrand factor type A (vWA) domain
MSYRYGAWRGGPDPLEPPFDVNQALDRLGERVLSGDRAADALRNLLRQGLPGTRGLRDLLRQARDRRRELRERGRLDGTLERVRELLDQAVDQERQALFPDPSDAARLAEAELDQLPPDTARAVRQLADYQWRSPEAAATYEQIRDLLRREVLDSQFRGMRDALAGASPEELQRIRDMVADLNAMLEADARGEDTQRQFEEFMERYGDMFPENPRSLEELVDALARRAAAASRLAASLTPEQRAELAALSESVLGDLGLQYELDRLGRSLRSRRPDLPWDQGAAWAGRSRWASATPPPPWRSWPTSSRWSRPRPALPGGVAGRHRHGGGRAGPRPGGRRRRRDPAAAGAGADRAGLPGPRAGRAQAEPQGDPAHRRRRPAPASSPASTRAAAATTTSPASAWPASPPAPRAPGSSATRSRWTWSAPSATPSCGARQLGGFGGEDSPRMDRAGSGVRLLPDDFEGAGDGAPHLRRRLLLVDQSYSMLLRETWGMAKATALALHSLVSTRFPQDALEVIGFSLLARTVRPVELPDLDAAVGRGPTCTTPWSWPAATWTGTPRPSRWSWSSPTASPPPTSEPDGYPVFDYPPDPRTIELTLAEVTRLTRRRATINVFMLDDDPRLVAFVDLIARLNGGRVFAPSPDRLGDYVVSDYLRARGAAGPAEQASGA